MKWLTDLLKALFGSKEKPPVPVDDDQTPDAPVVVDGSDKYQEDLAAQPDEKSPEEHGLGEIDLAKLNVVELEIG